MIDGLKQVYNKIKNITAHLDLDDFAPGTHSIQVKIDSVKDAELKKAGSKDTLDGLLTRLDLTERQQKNVNQTNNSKSNTKSSYPTLPVTGDYFVTRGKAPMHGITKWTYYIDNIGHLTSEKIRLGLIEIESKHPKYLLEMPSVWHKMYPGEKIPKLKSNKH